MSDSSSFEQKAFLATTKSGNKCKITFQVSKGRLGGDVAWLLGDPSKEDMEEIDQHVLILVQKVSDNHVARFQSKLTDTQSAIKEVAKFIADGEPLENAKTVYEK